MAELATIARPYAEALYKAAGAEGAALKDQVSSLAALAADAGLRQFADNPKVASLQVFQRCALGASGLVQGFGVRAGNGRQLGHVKAPLSGGPATRRARWR